MELTLQTKKEYQKFGLAFGLAAILVQSFPLIYGAFTTNVAATSVIGKLIIVPFSTPAILFIGLAILKSYKEKALFWIGLLGVWMSVILNLYIFYGGQEVLLETILNSITRKGMAMILSLLVLRYFFQKNNFIHLIIGFMAIVVLATLNSFLLYSEKLTATEILEQSLWGGLFYVFTLGIGYILFKIFIGNDDHEGEKVEEEIPTFSPSQLVFYFMLLGLYFADFWKGGMSWQAEMNILFQMVFAIIGIVYFSKNIITIGMALTLVSLIGRIVAFYQTNSAEAAFGIGFSLLVLGLFEFSRRSENKSNKSPRVKTK
ncbi:hypothetical protein [Flammeovirga agarivorans]|uniref:Uncharacterized protein n=1 Tax=Flammeovirga agarivorans TaxID=2726742 RepID=A0A7X8SQQ3_9BACT|nr:hypothetical protein [Flammeovirga agarivorans]NLR94661.1 hypothetical protein [Flammeovirga agarivorans]